MHSQTSTLHSVAIEPLGGVRDFSQRWNDADVLALPIGARDRYIVGFVNSDRCLENVLRLRYEIFNLELGEGLAESAVTGLDQDEFDAQMTHLVLLERDTKRVAGTYRMQTVSHALEQNGLYSAAEFDLVQLEPYFPKAVELGRACLAPDHRIFPAIISVWLGIGAYMNLYGQQYLFGCCSLTTQDPDDGWRAMKTVRANGDLHPDLFVPVQPGYTCGAPAREYAADLGPAIPLPKLFRTYMRLGAKVISEPAIDRRFGTVDFLVMIDGHEVSLSRLNVLQ